MKTLTRDPFLDPGLLGAFAEGLRDAAANCAAMSDGGLVFSSPDVRRLSMAEVIASAGGPDVPVAGMYVGFSGGLSGHGVLLLPTAAAKRLAAMVLGGLPDTSAADPVDSDLTELERSALEEVANVAVSTVLSSLGDYLGEPIHPAVPVFLFDMAGAILDAIAADAAGTDDTVLTARTAFMRDGREATGVLLVVPRPAPDPEVALASDEEAAIASL